MTFFRCNSARRYQDGSYDYYHVTLTQAHMGFPEGTYFDLLWTSQGKYHARKGSENYTFDPPSPKISVKTQPRVPIRPMIKYQASDGLEYYLLNAYNFGIRAIRRGKFVRGPPELRNPEVLEYLKSNHPELQDFTARRYEEDYLLYEEDVIEHQEYLTRTRGRKC